MVQRREFIKNSLLGTAGLALGSSFSAKSYAAIIGANDRINVAVAGIRSRGIAHINAWCNLKSENVHLTTLCDADEQFLDPRAKTVLEKTGSKPAVEWDIRRVLDNKDIDIVSMATPNHWHALGTIWACQAGKHVYIEKPACHTIWEGRKMIEAARKYNRRVQVGCQNRSIRNVREAMDLLHSGGIGEIYMARGLCIKPRDSFGMMNDSDPPAGLHYDRWLGPAPFRPYNEKHVHYNWHWFWATGNGDTGNQGPHQFDLARWGLNKKFEHPASVFSNGGIYGIDQTACDQETPNTQCSILKYSDGKIIEFETRGRYSNTESGLGIQVGNIFYGTEGYLELNGEVWKAYRKRETTPFAVSKESDKTNNIASLSGSDDTEHFLNLVQAVRAGNNDLLHCDIEDGFYSSALPLLSNIAYRVGGRQLNFNGQTEKFVNDKEADHLLKQAYRSPYIVPEKV